MTRDIYLDNVLRERWDDDARVVTFFNEQGQQIGQRAYGTAENAATTEALATAAKDVARRQYLADLAGGIAAITAARDAAQADIAVADGLQAGAVTLSGQIATHITQMQAFAPGATYSQAQMVAIRDAIIAVAQRQKTIVDAMSAMYGYRKAIDQNAVLTDNAILWLARIQSGALIDGGQA